MRKSMRAGLALTVAALSLAVMVSGASASHLRLSSQSFRITWRSLILGNTSNEARVLCPVTLEGTFHSATIAKTLGSLIGYVARASVNGSETACTGGTATILQATLPWHIQYGGFRGELPRLSGVVLSLVGAGFNVHINNSLTCLALTEARAPAKAIANVEPSGRVTSVTPERNSRIRLREGDFGCSFLTGFFEESEPSTTTENGAGAALTVTLI